MDVATSIVSSKWLWGILGGLTIAWIIYAGVIRPVTKPNPTTVQTGGVSYTYDIKLGFGSCAKFPK